MKTKINFLTSAIISLIFLILISIVTFSLIFCIKQKEKIGSAYDTEPIYIYVNNTTDSESSVDTEKWLIKEHNEKIGIFDNDGRLIQVIDTYVKTLPKIDRDELKEGFWLNDKNKLYSVIEAYSD